MKRGFTLIELLVAVSIIAVISTIGLNVFSGIQDKARDSIRKNDLQKLALALEIYYQNNGKYIYEYGPQNTNTGLCSDNTATFYTEIAPYISGSVPKDPKTKQTYCYVAGNFGKSFRLFAKLENCDNDVIDKTICNNPAYKYNYSITSDNVQIALAPEDTGAATNNSPGVIIPPTPQVNTKVVFVSTNLYDGNLNNYTITKYGAVEGDKRCQEEAALAPPLKNKIFKAWLSDNQNSAKDRLNHSTIPYALVDGTVVANNWDDLIDGSLRNPINKKQNGQLIESGLAWTGTDKNGQKTLTDCNSWRVSYSTSGMFGDISSTSNWSLWGNKSCDTKLRLYCFEQ